MLCCKEKKGPKSRSTPSSTTRCVVVIASDKLHHGRGKDHISKMMSNVGIALQEYILALADPSFRPNDPYFGLFTSGLHNRWRTPMPDNTLQAIVARSFFHRVPKIICNVERTQRIFTFSSLSYIYHILLACNLHSNFLDLAFQFYHVIQMSVCFYDSFHVWLTLTLKVSLCISENTDPYSFDYGWHNRIKSPELRNFCGEEGL